MFFGFVALGLVLAFQTGNLPSTPQQDLATLLEKSRVAMGGDRLAQVKSVDYRLRLEEDGRVFHGHYRAVAEGKMRIDIFVNGSRVFTEAYNGRHAWQCMADSTTIEQSSPEGAAALRHGLELPGHFLTFLDMRGRGHRIALDGYENLGGRSCPVLLVTLADGHQAWYVLDPESGMVLKKRSFRALHPDADPEKKWLETRFSDFRAVDGIPRAFSSIQVDLKTGAVLQTVTLEQVSFNQAVNPALFEGL